MDPTPTRILLADDHALVRRGLRLILDGEPDLTVVGEAGDGAQAVEIATHDDVDIAILDIAMPRMTGLQAAREMSRRSPRVRILMLSMYDNEQYFFEALKAEGNSSKDIADTLVISAKTVDRHRSNVLQKLGMHDRLDLTRYAIRAGLIEP